MKAKILLAFALMAMFLMPFAAVAQEDIANGQDAEEIELPDAGVTPDSPFWGLDVAFDKISLALAGGANAKAEKGLQIAQERLAEMNQMAEENRAEAAEKAQNKHQEILNKVKEEVEKIDGEEKDITGIELGMANHIAALEQVRAKIHANENIPEAAREKLMNNFQNQIANAEELEIKVQNKKAQIALRIQEEAKLEAEGEEAAEEAKEERAEEAAEGKETAEGAAETGNEDSAENQQQGQAEE